MDLPVIVNNVIFKFSELAKIYWHWLNLIFPVSMDFRWALSPLCQQNLDSHMLHFIPSSLNKSCLVSFFFMVCFFLCLSQNPSLDHSLCHYPLVLPVLFRNFSRFSLWRYSTWSLSFSELSNLHLHWTHWNFPVCMEISWALSPLCHQNVESHMRFELTHDLKYWFYYFW